MDRRLIDYYERELRVIREGAAEFARDFPKIAGRLSLDEFECADPYVERLLEGFAFLTARVQLKMDAEFPRLTRHLLEVVYPHYLCPMPSMCVAQIRPDLDDAGLAEGLLIPRGSALRSGVGRGEQTACEYRTAHPVRLLPIELVEAQYHDRDLGTLDLPRGLRPAAALRIRLRASAGLTIGELAMDSLSLYIRGSASTPGRIHEQVFAHATEILVRPASKPVRWTRRLPAHAHLRQPGFGEDEAMLPQAPRTFSGYRWLQEFFAFPERFMFAEVTGLREAASGVREPEFELLILLDEVDVELEGAVSAQNFMLHCTPAVNLFERRADRINVTDRFSEFHLVVDRTRPLDYEVYDVVSIEGYGADAARSQVFRPFYRARDDDEDRETGGAFFTVSRQPRGLSDQERRLGRRARYTGGEVYVSLVDASEAPYSPDLRQIGSTVRCTNRDLPTRMPLGLGRTDFSMAVGAAVESVRCVAGPTPPRPSFADGETLWRLISHLSLNYLSLVDADRETGPRHAGDRGEARGAAALRDLLRIYSDPASAASKKQIEGLRSVVSEPVSRRVPLPGPITFARGLRVTVEFEDSAFEGAGCFLLGAVLDRFFARYVSINSFTETVIRTRERGEIMAWPARIGQRRTL